jgi:predicted peptidase
MKNLFGYGALFACSLSLFVSCKKDDAVYADTSAKVSDVTGGTSNAPDPNAVAETRSAVQKPVTVSVSGGIGGYQEALPARYDSTTKKYPLLIFIHGTGEMGDGNANLGLVANIGTAGLIKAQKFPASFTVNGVNHSFIVLSPQFKRWPAPEDINALIDHAVAKYRIDQSRIYVSGLSMGGGATWDYAAAFSNRVAAIAPICGATEPTAAKGQKIADGKVAVWAFHNMDDRTVTVHNTIGFIEKINAAHPSIPARSTLWANGGHDSWSRATDPNYRENGLNMYEWLLQYSK